MPTLKEIAREAGVSGALVSYYLNGGGKGRMREETRRRIDEAIRKLKYHPNRLARSLRTGRSRSIGFLAGNIANPYIGHLAEEALEEALEHDYTLIPALTEMPTGNGALWSSSGEIGSTDSFPRSGLRTSEKNSIGRERSFRWCGRHLPNRGCCRSSTVSGERSGRWSAFSVRAGTRPY